MTIYIPFFAFSICGPDIADLSIFLCGLISCTWAVTGRCTISA